MTISFLEIARHFDIPKGEIEICTYGNGHINDTFLVKVTSEKHPDRVRKFIAQRINTFVFKNPVEVIRNIEKVTRYLRGIIVREGGDPDRETLTLVSAAGGKYYVVDDEGGFWRMYTFVSGTMTRDLPDTPELFGLSGAAFGKFQRQMVGFPAEELFESIPHFHDTPDRYRQLMEAVEKDACGRLKDVIPELEFCMQREKDTHVLLDAMEKGEIPIRVTHNDTKLNNVLLDEKTGAAVCVIDLDTVMPGLAAYDFGDSIRFGANTAAEDETDLSKVQLSLEMYRAYCKGFLSEAAEVMTKREIELLPMGAKLMTLECGMRFLTDYLNGDVYFRIHRPGHNLDRARTQFELVRRMEENWEEMKAIIEGA